MRNHKAFTLVEVIAVLIILSVVLTIIVPNFQRAVERARTKEAVASLRLIQAGERIYRSEQEPAQFFPWAGEPQQATADINDNLHLSLTNQPWTYTVDPIVVGGRSENFTALATRAGQTWMIRRVDCNDHYGPCCAGPNCPDNPDSAICTCP